MDPQRAVSRELVLAVLEDAHWAPTHGLTQPWRFQVFATPSSRARLGAGLQALYDETTPEVQRDEAKRTKLAIGPRQAPVVLAVAAHVVAGGRIPEWEERAAVACALQNLMLSAHLRGLGSFWSTPPVSCGSAFARWLGLDQSHCMMGLVYLGWPRSMEDSLAAATATRGELADRVVWHDD